MTRFCGIHSSHSLCKKKKTCKSFNKIDSSWLFTCIRVTLNLTNQPRPGECTFKTSELCELTIQLHCLRLPTVHELLYLQPEKCTVQFLLSSADTCIHLPYIFQGFSLLEVPPPLHLNSQHQIHLL